MMKTIVLIIFLCAVFFGSSVAAEYCAGDDEGSAVGCSMMVSTGDPMDPAVAFVAKREGESRTWQLGIRLLQKEPVELSGDSDVRIDGGENHKLSYISSRQAEVTTEIFSASASYSLSEDLVRSIASSSDEVRLTVPTADSGPREIVVSSEKLAELSALIAEAQEKL